MRGVSLIELMVVLVIIGILVAIAYPGYQSQMQKTRRADGQAALLNAAQALERCFTRFNVYNNAGCPIVAPLAGGTPSPQLWYVVTDAAPAANTFALVATPQGVQVGDTQCANLTLDSTGDRSSTGTLGDDCW
jgi:type IV pilus assembly protein PilE